MYFNLSSSTTLPAFALLLLTNAGSYVTAQDSSIYQLAGQNPSLSILAGGVTAAGLDGVLNGTGSFTVFAPIDDAFLELGDAFAKYLEPEWKNHLADIIAYHALSTEVLSTELVDGPVVTLNGESITIDATTLTINESSNIDPNSNDIQANNGVVHLIDSVLLPNSVTQDIVGIASSKDDLSTLVSLLTAAELVDDLQTSGPFTVFAPNNAAFAKVPAAEVEDLQNDKDALTDVLLYHVVQGIYNIEDLIETDLEALNGDVLHVEVGVHDHRSRKLSAEEVTINDAHIVDTFYANNGVIHVVDMVIEHDHGTSSANSMKYFMSSISLVLAGAFAMLI